MKHYFPSVNLQYIKIKKEVDKVNMTYSFIRLEFLLKTSFGKCFNLLFESVLQQKRKSVLTQIVKG